jgi:hypothetical protein
MFVVGGLLVAVMAAPAVASVPTLTRVDHDVDPGSTDTINFGTPAWDSGRLTYSATRLPDGRIRVSMHARLVATRKFLAQMAVSPCDATYNLATPIGLDTYPLRPLVTWMGTDVTATKQMHKGTNEVRLAGIVSSDQRFTPVPRHWTDCAAANVLDVAENDKAALEEAPTDANRFNDPAFHWLPLILSVTTDGQHL